MTFMHHYMAFLSNKCPWGFGAMGNTMFPLNQPMGVPIWKHDVSPKE